MSTWMENIQYLAFRVDSPTSCSALVLMLKPIGYLKENKKQNIKILFNFMAKL